jgi:hypothetical protein
MNIKSMFRAIVVGLAGLVSLPGCGTTYPNRNVVGEKFPTVQGKSLSGEEMTLPDKFKGTSAIIVIGYVQDTQFDLDRWGIGFFTADLPLPPVYEVPTIPGLLPSLFKESIDKGMRSGIPKESWKDVVTVYGSDGGKIAQWTGTEAPRNGRIILLDENGIVLWMHDKGYGLPPLKSLLDVLGKQRAGN